MKSLLLFFIVLSTTYLVKAQNIGTTLIQSFDSKKEIIDVPLIENEFIYIHLYDYGNYIQKRNLKDNSLIKEVFYTFLDVNGNSMKDLILYKEIFELNSELYITTKLEIKEKKVFKVIIFKLDKESLIFKEYLTLDEIPYNKAELSLYSYTVNKEGKKYLVITSKLYDKKSNDYPINKYIISGDGKLIKDEILLNSLISMRLAEKSEHSTLFNNSKISYKDESYIGYISHHIQDSENETNNYFALVQNDDKKDKTLSLINYNFQDTSSFKKSRMFHEKITYLLPFFTSSSVGLINNLKLYNEFNFTNSNKVYNKLSVFGLGENYFFIHEERPIIRVENTDDWDASFRIDKIEVASVNKNGTFNWYKNIDFNSYSSSKTELISYFQFEYNNKLILMFLTKYLLIDITSGEITINNYQGFNLIAESYTKKFIIKPTDKNNGIIVFTSTNEKHKLIAKIQFDE